MAAIWFHRHSCTKYMHLAPKKAVTAAEEVVSCVRACCAYVTFLSFLNGTERMSKKRQWKTLIKKENSPGLKIGSASSMRL